MPRKPRPAALESLKQNPSMLPLLTRRPFLVSGFSLGAGLLLNSQALWAQAAPAATAVSGGTGPIELAKDAPDQYTVVKGDTLWDISGKFLAKPWRWPEIWQLNKEQIKNPHLIYPGDVIFLDTSSGSPRLRLGRNVSSGNNALAGERNDALRPSARVSALDRSPIPTISSAAIDAFLNRPLIVEENSLAATPRIVGTQEGRVFLGRGDLAYARGIKDNAIADWHLYRSARPLLDPETRLPIAHEALWVGSARTERNGDPTTLRITSTSEEVGVGDRLMPAERARVLSYAPRAPEGTVKGRIISVHRGVAQAGRNSVVAISAGKNQSLDVGHVLSIMQRGQLVLDREVKEHIRLPDEPSGYLLVFRVFDKIAYGLILDSARSVTVGDGVVNPQS
jgi:LysM repeat protein